MKKYSIFFIGITLLSTYSQIFTNLTTLQHWDPSPIYSATNFMMPSHTYIANVKKERLRNDKKTKDRCFGVSFSGLVQGACRSIDCSGCNEFGTICSGDTSANGQQMGDFRGTLYGFGLFLGNSPNGNNIWASGVNNGNIYNITPNSINGTQLPLVLKNIAKQLSGNFDLTTGLPTASSLCITNPSQALMFCPDDVTVADASKDCFGPSIICIPNEVSTICAMTFPSSASCAVCPTTPICMAGSEYCYPLAEGPSIFDTKKLKNDKTYFGSYSLPLEYKKYAFRMEFHAEFSDNIGITMQTGIAHIKQKTSGIIDLSKVSCSDDSSTCSTCSYLSSGSGTLYDQLAFQGVNGDTSICPNVEQKKVSDTTTDAQTVFDLFFINKQDEILGPDGINQVIKSFEDYSIEDVRIFLTFKNSHGLNRYFKDNEDERSKWPEMLFTIYGWAGGTFPVAEKKDYTQYLSLPFGNNGHVSLGTGLGMAYDFEETIEVGAEIGCTYFLSREECRPFPNHELQRGLYPFYADVTTEPGLNWHFKAMMNAYQCLPHVSFWASYEFIEHTKDRYKFCFDNIAKKPVNPLDIPDASASCPVLFCEQNPGNPYCISPSLYDTPAEIVCCQQSVEHKSALTLPQATEERIFIPEVLENCSEWRAQFINLAVTFNINPSMQASLVWQQPISPRNAYYPVSVVGSLSFIF